MTDKKPNKEQQVSPELIRQYLAGELDDKAMHALERQALDDPFLADALEGFESVAPDQQHNIDELHARLNERVQPAKGKIRALYYRFAAAAAILLVMVVGGYYLVNTTVKPPEVAMKHEADTAANTKDTTDTAKQEPAAQEDTMPAGNQQPPVTLAQRAAPPKKAQKPTVNELEDAKPAANKWASQPHAAKTNATDSMLEKSHNDLNEVVVMGYATQRKRSVTGSITKIEPALVAMDKSPNQDTSTIESALAGKVAGVSVTYKKKAVKKEDTLRIVMFPNESALNEIVVVGYGKSDGDEETPPTPTGARPYGGYTEFKKYIAKNTRVSDTALIGATVRIAFKVDKDGGLSDFRIIKGKNIAAGEAAINIIKHGPKWEGAKNNEDQTVKVKITFKRRKE